MATSSSEHGAGPVRYPYRLLIAVVALSLAVQPALLPHPIWVQAVIGGAAAAQVHGLTALGQALLRLGRLRSGRLRSGRPGSGRRLPRPGAWLAAGLCLGLLLTAAFFAHAGQVELCARTGMPPPSPMADALGVAGAVLFAAVLAGLGTGLRAGARALAAAVRRAPRRAAVLVLVPALLLTGSTAAVARSGRSPDAGPGRSPQAAAGTVPGVRGEAFLRGRPSAATLRAVTGRPARTPVRVYVGLGAAATGRERAALAVRALERAGGFDRAAVLVALPTGSGWVNPAAGTALEYLYGGDVASVAVQYAASPSWVAYLRGGEGAQQSARTLIDAVRARLDRIPAGRRPRLLVHGESLGAWGGLRAYDPGGSGAGLMRRADGVLWSGVPGGLPGPLPDRMRVLVHPDDPVPAWALPLQWRPSPAWPARWLPVVSFWQATGDSIAATGVPAGFGHRYGPELVDAWRPLIAGTTGAR